MIFCSERITIEGDSREKSPHYRHPKGLLS